MAGIQVMGFRTRPLWRLTDVNSETEPNQGTLQVFPDIILANAYIILRPFFSLVADPQGDPLDATNWKFGEG